MDLPVYEELLTTAAAGTPVSTVIEFLERLPDPEDRKQFTNMIPSSHSLALIHVAAWQGDANAVFSIVAKYGGIVGIPTSNDQLEESALHIAAKRGYLRCAQALIEQGAHPSDCDALGRSCVDVAADDDMRQFLCAYLQVPLFHRIRHLAGAKYPLVAGGGFKPLQVSDSCLHALTQASATVGEWSTDCRENVVYVFRAATKHCIYAAVLNVEARMIVEIYVTCNPNHYRPDVVVDESARSGAYDDFESLLIHGFGHSLL
jgi:ankyrin repeat protein